MLFAILTTPSLCIKLEVKLGSKLPRGVPSRSEVPGRRKLIRDALLSGCAEHTSSRMFLKGLSEVNAALDLFFCAKLS